MNFFNRLFGDRPAKESSANQPPGASALLFPVIHNGSWHALDKAVQQTLIGTPEQPTVVATFAYDEPSLKYITYDDIGNDINNATPLINAAYDNLDNYTVSIEEEATEFGKILKLSPNRFTSEKMLCAALMQQMQEILQTDELLVSIPRRTVLYAVDNKCSGELYSRFRSLHIRLFEDANVGTPQLINGFFLLKNGAVSKYLPIANKEDFLSDAEITEAGEIMDEYTLAKKLYAEEKYAESRDKLVSIIHKNEAHFEAQNYLAFIYEFKEKNPELAEKHYLLSLKYNPHYPAANLNYASFLNTRRRLQEAEERLKKCEALEVNRSLLAYEWAYFYEQKQEYDKAIEKYKAYGMLIYDIKELEATVERIERCRNKKEILES